MIREVWRYSSSLLIELDMQKIHNIILTSWKKSRVIFFWKSAWCLHWGFPSSWAWFSRNTAALLRSIRFKRTSSLSKKYTKDRCRQLISASDVQYFRRQIILKFLQRLQSCLFETVLTKSKFFQHPVWVKMSKKLKKVDKILLESSEIRWNWMGYVKN